MITNPYTKMNVNNIHSHITLENEKYHTM